MTMMMMTESSNFDSRMVAVVLVDSMAVPVDTLATQMVHR